MILPLTPHLTGLKLPSTINSLRPSKLTIIGSDNGLSPDRRQAIIWTNAGILLIGTLGTNLNEILFEIRIFSFKKMGFNVLSGKWRPLCFGLNVLMARVLVSLVTSMWTMPEVIKTSIIYSKARKHNYDIHSSPDRDSNEWICSMAFIRCSDLPTA